MSISWILVASVILMSWRVMRRVTTGASFRALGDSEAVTTTGSSSTESRMVCAEIPTVGMNRVMPTKMVRKKSFINFSVTIYCLMPVKVVVMANGILPYFSENVATTFFSLKITIMSLTV